MAEVLRVTADPDVVDDGSRHRYEITADGRPAGFAQYRLSDGGGGFGGGSSGGGGATGGW